MPLELSFLLAGGRLPQLHHLVATARGQRRPVTREGHARGRCTVRGHRRDLRAVRRVPQDDRAILARGRQPRAIGREVERPHPALVLLEVVLEGAARKIPELHEAVVAGRRRELPICRDLHGPYRRRVTRELTHPSSVGRLPDDHVPRSVEQALTTGCEEERSIPGEVGCDDPPLRFGDRCRGGLLRFSGFLVCRSLLRGRFLGRSLFFRRRLVSCRLVRCRLVRRRLVRRRLVRRRLVRRRLVRRSLVRRGRRISRP